MAYPMIQGIPPSAPAAADASDGWQLALGDAEGASLFARLRAAGATFAAGRSGGGWRFVGVGPAPRPGAVKVAATRLAAARAEVARLASYTSGGAWGAWGGAGMIYS